MRGIENPAMTIVFSLNVLTATNSAMGNATNANTASPISVARHVMVRVMRPTTSAPIKNSGTAKYAGP